MKLTGFLLWIGMSVLVSYVGTVIFRFSIFNREKIWKIRISDLKIAIMIALSEIVMISYIHLNNVLGIFGYFGIFLYPIEDAILSGILVSAGSNFTYQIYKTILNYKDLLMQKKELLEKAKERINK